MLSAHETHAVGTADVARFPNPNIIDSFKLKSGERIYLSDLEKHGLSYVPCDYKSPAVDRYAHLWNQRKQVTLASYGETVTDWYVFKQMQGVQIMTGQPTFLPSETSPIGFLYLMDFDIETLLKTRYPEHYKRLLGTIYELHGDRTPCHIETKSNGDRFSLYGPGFGKKVSYTDKMSGEMLFEFFSKNGLSRLDNRYGIVKGSLFDIPQFHSYEEINRLTGALCEILEEIGGRHQSRSTRDAKVVETSQIGGLDIQWVATTIEKDDGTSYDALVSQRFPTENCHETEHRSNRKEVSFTKFENGSVLGKCFNCGESWWEVKTSHTVLPRSFEEDQAVIERLIADAPAPEPDRYTPKRKLLHCPNADPESVESLDENEAARDAAVDAFLSGNAANGAKQKKKGKKRKKRKKHQDRKSLEDLKILLIRDATGTGKTHGILAKAQAHKSRTVALSPHIKLAEQAVDIAYKVGFLSPTRIVSREQNWDASGIAAIPEEHRSRDLFFQPDPNKKCLCLMVDEIKKHAEKRIAPRTFCEMTCRFHSEGDGDDRELTCPYLLQFVDIDKRDFVATCSPNVFFDLRLHGYLSVLVGGSPDAVSTEEEMAIDALWGTGADRKSEAVFDLGIIDDYTLAGLYSEIQLRASEIETVAKVWKGTPTGTFAGRLLKALKKEKPSAIVKKIRKAVDIPQEELDTIAKDLTVHLWKGRVAWLEPAKGEKDSHGNARVLAEKEVVFDDGSRRWIPTSMKAYEKLLAKRHPAINPKRLDSTDVGDRVRVSLSPAEAIREGIALEDMTPFWQVGATPVDLLRIFLGALGAEQNIPLQKKYTAGAASDPILEFTLPPQAPVGILSAIAMLSATNDIQDVKSTFAGQSVMFSEFEGRKLRWAKGVQVYQFAEARMTSASVFKYRDVEGKRSLQEDPIGLKPSAAARLEKLNRWAEEIDGKTAFISYKEFTGNFADAVSNFDIVTHFDQVAGLNFECLKFLVVFGYPKVKHEIVMEHARIQFASDSEPLPAGDYKELTEDVTSTENGITVTERRYKAPRLEKVRHQLSTEKLEQALGRARFVRWEDTITILFSSAPVSASRRATLFSQDAFRVARSPNDISAATERIAEAEASGDVKAVMEAKGVSVATARRQTKHVRDRTDAARDAEIFRQHAEGFRSTRISQHLRDLGFEKGVSPRNVREILYSGKNDQG